MNREIKFRAWDKTNQRMISYVNILGISEGFICGFDRNWIHNSMDWCNEDDYSENFELMQFTGLKDKNSTEIYEDDICITEKGYYFRIVWNNDRTRFVGVTKEEYAGRRRYKCTEWIASHCAVIGNIYETPELLK